MKRTTPLKRTRKKRKGPTPMKAADAAFALYIRSRGACENCHRAENIQCAHGFTRSYKAIRVDERNAFALCQKCHMYFTHHPLEWDQWLREKWGDALYAELRTKALSYEKVDWKQELARFRALNEEAAA